jgi:hypothetical protein
MDLHSYFESSVTTLTHRLDNLHWALENHRPRVVCEAWEYLVYDDAKKLRERVYIWAAQCQARMELELPR